MAWERGSSQEKAGEWSRRLRRFEKTDQTVAAFCEGEGVGEHQSVHRRSREPTIREAAPSPSGCSSL